MTARGFDPASPDGRALERDFIAHHLDDRDGGSRYLHRTTTIDR
jgi:hypothetical protein